MGNRMRKAHPNLYKAYASYALLSISLGLNFLFLTPTFMPLNFPKEPIGIALVVCGVTKAILLILRMPGSIWLRLSLTLTVFIYSFWAGATTFDFFRLSQTSMQLPLTYIGLAVLGFVLLSEPFTNPATAMRDEE